MSRTTRARGGDSPGDIVRALAPAKVNLVLEILGRRADGYHEVRTAMLALALCDLVEVRRTSAGAIELELAGEHASPDIPAGPDNLAARAAARVLDQARARDRAGRSTGLALRLEKRIPSQAGLGGASSDAAAAALASARALGLDLEPAALDALLAELGSDCVFFARAAQTGFAWCTGRGERVAPEPTPWPKCFVAVLTPDVVCSTRAVYAALGDPLSGTGEIPTLRSAAFASPLDAARQFFFNRLEAVALAAIPGLRPWRQALDAASAEHFRLSGSGSSFFGLFDDEREAEQTLQRIERELDARGLASRGRWLSRTWVWGARLLLDS